MNDNTNHPNHPDAERRQQAQPPRQEVVGPTDSLAEPTLAVDLATAEIDRLIATAHRFPRKLDTVAKQIEQMVLHDEAAAENSVYALPRGKKPIVGPSIGFANSVATAWGNCWDDGHWLHTDRREKVVVSRGVFIDFQTGRRTTISEQRRIVDSKGILYSDDMIIVTSKAASAVARRNAILAGVPRPLWFPVYEKALYVVRGSETTLAENREKAIKALANFGVTPKQVFLYLGVKDIGEIGVEHIPTLRGMFTQLRDGAATPEEMFNPRYMTGRGFETVENPLADDDEESDDRAPAADQRPAQATNAAATRVEPEPEPTDETEAKTVAPAAVQQQPTKAAAPTAEATTPAKASARPAAAATESNLSDTSQDIGPKTSAEYVEHCLAWLETADERSWPAINIEEMWKGERKRREACGVVEDDFDKVNKRYREVLNAAKAREKGK